MNSLAGSGQFGSSRLVTSIVTVVTLVAIVDQAFQVIGIMKRGSSLGDITNGTLDDNDRNGGFTQVKSRRKKSKKSSLAQTQSDMNNLIDGVIDSVVSQVSSDTQRTKTSTDNASVDEIQRLTAEIDSLKQTVQHLTGQLSFVLSFLGIVEGKGNESSEVIEVAGSQLPSSVVSDFPPLFLSPPTMAACVVGASASASASSVPDTSYSSVAKKNSCNTCSICGAYLQGKDDKRFVISSLHRSRREKKTF